MQVVNFVGYSGSGKTTLVEKLVAIFTQAGLKVSAIKNAHHGVQVDKKGKDSWRFAHAGAKQVIIHTAESWALISQTPEKPATLADLLKVLNPCDLVLVEGFKSEPSAGLRLEVWREGVNAEQPLYKSDKSIEALVTDDKSVKPENLEVLNIDSPLDIAKWIASKLKLNARF
ncbi:MAG: molybdopterin-guanine dinucleotide biosynthesis protein B [Burkholderiales bacterium]|nr:molybdopterin-guanine dinucleotide biosynthesis protein B [Burkholderiales bacterium]